MSRKNTKNERPIKNGLIIFVENVHVKIVRIVNVHRVHRVSCVGMGNLWSVVEFPGIFCNGKPGHLYKIGW